MKKTKHGDFETVVKFPVFADWEIHVIYCEDLVDAQTSRFGDIEPDDAQALHTSLDGISRIFLLLGDEEPGTWAHEAYHAISYMFERLGILPDEEVLAYHIGYLVDKIDYFRAKLMMADVW